MDTMNDKLVRLGTAARELNDGSDKLNRLVAEIDKLLGRLMIGLDYVHPRPIHERVTTDKTGHRVTELAFLAYLKVQGGYHLAVKTVKVLEAKHQVATEQPGRVTPLLASPRRIRYAAVDVLPELVSGLAEQVDDVVSAMERRCATAEALLEHLQDVARSGVRRIPPIPKPRTRSESRTQPMILDD